MQQTVLAFVIAVTFGTFAASTFAMTENEYKVEKARLREAYSHQFVNCVDKSGRERADCQSKLRKERNEAMDKLDRTYQATKG